MASKRRATAADQVAAIARGDMDAIRAAEQLLSGGKGEKIEIRVSGKRKELYQQAAKKVRRKLSDCARDALDDWAAGVLK